MFDRLRVLLTGEVTWCDPVTGEPEETERLGWRDRWSLIGPHPWNWWWVRRWGSQPCGCMVNPLTRQPVLWCSRHTWGDDVVFGGDDDE